MQSLAKPPAAPSPVAPIADKIRDGDVAVGVVGLGFVGSTMVDLIAGAGLRTVGYDRDVARVNNLESRLHRTGFVSASPDAACLSDLDVIVIAVRLSAAFERLDTSPLRMVADALNALPQRERLVLLSTTVPPGTTRTFVTEWLAEPLRDATRVAYCPERLEVGDDADSAKRMTRVVGALGETAADAAAAFFERVGVSVTLVSSPEVAELCKLLENAFLTTGICLMGEMTRIAHALGVSAGEVARAASTKTRGYLPFRPGPGIGGHCLLNDLDLLQKAFEASGLRSSFLEGIAEAAEQLTPTVVSYLERCMAGQGLTLRSAVICIIGIGFKPGASDTTNTAAADVVRALRRKGAKVTYCDRSAIDFVVDGIGVERVSPPIRATAALILSGDQSMDLADVARHVSLVIDAGGGRVMPGSRETLVDL